MNPAIIGLIAFAVVGGLGVAYCIRAAAKRREELKAIARDNCVLYQEMADHVLPTLANLPLFSRGHSRKAADLVSDSAGEEFWVFEYRYVTGSGKNSRRHRMTVAAFPRLGAELPPFELSREHIFHKIGQAFGFQDIDFPECPSFSKRYLLRGQREMAIRRLFDGHLLDFLAKIKELNVEANGGVMVIYRAGVRVRPAELLGFLDEAATVRDAFLQRAFQSLDRHPPSPLQPPAFI
jgi:hypothetical protein